MAMKIFSLTSVVISAAVVWSEALFFKKSPVLSVFALLMSAAKDHHNHVFIEVSSSYRHKTPFRYIAFNFEKTKALMIIIIYIFRNNIPALTDS